MRRGWRNLSSQQFFYLVFFITLICVTAVIPCKRGRFFMLNFPAIVGNLNLHQFRMNILIVDSCVYFTWPLRKHVPLK